MEVGNIKHIIDKTSKKLDQILRKEEEIWDQREIKLLERELEKLLSQEELHWQQRSRNTWLTSGDRNTAFFHRCALDRRRWNTIKSLKDEQVK
ncbi:hypothetical protein ACS0TY_013241 [Phlomoides rotata]